MRNGEHLNTRTKLLASALAALALTLGLAACGGGSDDENVVSGSFELVPGAPTGYENLSGEAELVRADGETTTTIDLDGLEPETEYMAHLHVAGCDAADPGGPHFQFEKGGSEEPPNEIHLTFTSNGDGSGKAEVSSDREVPEGEAGSVVLHLASHHQMAALLVHGDEEHGAEGEHEEAAPDKLACAELEGGSAEAGGEEAEATEAETAPESTEGGEAEAGSGAAVPTVVVKNGEPVGGIQKLEVDSGDQIRFKVTGDEAEEIHLHGYDVTEEIPAGGGTVEFDLPAEIEGIFEAELEGQGVQILELVVNP